MIRPARPDEAQAVAALVDAAFRPYLPRTVTPPAPMSIDYVAAVAAGLVDVWVEAQTVAGMVLLHDRPDHLLLDVIAVDPSLRRRGVGGALLAHVEAEAARRGFAEVRLFTHAAMVEAQAVYIRRGYLETARATEDGRPRVYHSKRIS